MLSNRSDIHRLCQCGICQDRPQDAHICPECSNPFCSKCITEWLSHSRNCPVCRKQLIAERLVKARFYEQLQEVIENRSMVECGAHKKQVSLFCWPCLECICVTCMVTDTHAGHQDQIVLCESAAQDINNRITNELKWIVDRESEKAHAVGQHEQNVKTLTTERDRIMGNVQQVLTEVKEQFEEACAKLQEMISLPEGDNNSNTELRRASEKLTKSGEPILPEFKNDLIPELVVFHLKITGKGISKTFWAKPGFKFEIQATPEQESAYNVSLSMTQGIAGEYLVALGNGPLAPIMFYLRKATHLGRVKPKRTPSSIRIRIQLAKTYGEKWRQYQAIKHEKHLDQLDRDINWFMGFIFLITLVFVFFVFKPTSGQLPQTKLFDWWYKLFNSV